MTALLCLVAALLGLITGIMWREVHRYIKRIDMAVRVLIAREQKKEKAEQQMSFVEPARWDDLSDQEKIDLLN